MIQNKTSLDRTVSGNLTGERVQMGVGDMAHILNVVTDLYADRELAPIREYSTNARDAHIEAGVTSPIEVSTPTHLSPFLTIRDFGIGLSLEDIRTVYSQYGISTKRGTNAQNGMLGLGCKSALTYTDQFTVTSVKDGVRIQVVVSRDSSGASMKVVDTADTSEPNGTTVIIPARQNNQFERKAANFFRFWAPGTVKLNGKQPELLPDALWVEQDKLAVLKGTTSYIVMGGVAYPAPNMHHGLNYDQSVVAFVPIGAVDFSPSRESLMDTDTTKATLRQVVAALKSKLAASIKADIEKAATAREAVQRRIDWRNRVPQPYMPVSVRFKGKDIPASIQTPAGTIQAPLNGRKMTANHALPNGISIEQVYRTLWVTGWDHASYTATTRKKLDKYVEDNGLQEIGSYLLSPIPLADKSWLEDVRFVDWSDIKAIKLPRNAPNPVTGRIPGSYDIYEDGTFEEGVPGDDIDTSNPVFWMNGRYYDGRPYAQYLKDKHPGCTLVVLRSGREAKFQRLFPKAENAEKLIRADFAAWVKTVKRDDAVAWACQNDYRLSDLDELSADDVDDPEVKHAIKVRNRDLSALQAEVTEWQKVGMYYSTDAASINNPLRKYPLLPEGYNMRQLKRAKNFAHVTRYMNAEFLYQTQQAAAKAAGN